MIAEMKQTGASNREISAATGVSPSTLTFYLAALETTAQAVVSKDGEVTYQKASPARIVSKSYDIIWLTLERLYDDLKAGGKHLSPGALNQLMAMVSQVDKIQRLDAGTATEIYDYKILKLEEIKVELDLLMPRNIVSDAAIEVEKLRAMDWDKVPDA